MSPKRGHSNPTAVLDRSTMHPCVALWSACFLYIKWRWPNYFRTCTKLSVVLPFIYKKHQQQWEEAMGERWTWSWIFLLVPIECGPSFQAILVRNVTIQMLPSLAALIEVNAVGQPLHNIQFVRGSALGDPRIVSQTLQTLRGHWTANRIQIDCNCVNLRNQDGPIKSMIQ